MFQTEVKTKWGLLQTRSTEQAVATATLENCVKMADFTIPNNAPVFNLECKAAFDALEDKEKKYAHFLSQADYEGGLIVLVQTSPESVPIFLLFQRLFSEQDFVSLKKSAQAADKRITDEDFQVR